MTDPAVAFRRLARDVRAAGDKDLQRALSRGLASAVKPVKVRAQASAVAVLPRRGGLGAAVAKARFGVRKRGGANPGVTIRGRRGDWDLAGMDEGRVRRTQRIRAGWWSDAIEPVADDARREVGAVLDDIAAKLAAGKQ